MRGQHAYGLAAAGPSGLRVCRTFAHEDVLRLFDPQVATIAHARYSTSGDWRTLANNQPLMVDETALAFNGVIHQGTKQEFEAAFQVQCTTDNDGEVFLRCVAAGETPAAFVARITGSFAGAWLTADGHLHAVRNARRPLWWCYAFGARWVASTRDILWRARFPLEAASPIHVGVEYVW